MRRYTDKKYITLPTIGNSCVVVLVDLVVAVLPRPARGVAGSTVRVLDIELYTSLDPDAVHDRIQAAHACRSSWLPLAYWNGELFVCLPMRDGSGHGQVRIDQVALIEPLTPSGSLVVLRSSARERDARAQVAVALTPEQVLETIEATIVAANGPLPDESPLWHRAS